MAENKDWTTDKKAELVLDILAGERKIEDAALEHELSREQIEGWRNLYVKGLREGARSTAHSPWQRLACGGRRFPFQAAGIVLIAALALFISSRAISQAVCTDLGNNVLCEFFPNTPAKATEMNANFTKLDNAITGFETKIGARSSTTITMSNDADIMNVDLIVGYNDIRFRGSAAQAADDVVIGSNGSVTLGTTAVTSLNAYIKSYLQSNCKISLGFRDACNNSSDGCATDTSWTRWVTIGVNGGTSGTGYGAYALKTGDSTKWGGIETDGIGSDNNELLYVAFTCN